MITANQAGAVTTIVHIRTPGYKQEYGDGTQGWAVEKGLFLSQLAACLYSIK